ncbi:MAG: hypothetical protein CMJ18_04960 [Phycisphaeraceae bacterium]|nr:hypothetical protein [Phycisphaeraceae bacterium]
MNQEPFYFSSGEHRLFACHHRPRRDAADGPEHHVVVCNPIGHEYIRAHRALRQLAIRLANAGCHVLRFDYACCGDSSGDGQATIAQWIADVEQAVIQLQRRSHAARVCVVGLRLGANLALLGAARSPAVDRLVLWSPVDTGGAYLDEIRSAHRAHLEALGEPVPEGAEAEADLEVLGFQFSPQLIDDLGRLDASTAALDRRIDALRIAHALPTNGDRVGARLRDRGVSLEDQVIEGPRIWLAEPYEAIVPHQTLQTVVGWIGGRP